MPPVRRFIRILLTVKPLLWGTMIAAVISAASVLAPLISPVDPLAQDLSASLSAPGGQWILGTDALGRDVFSRVVYGSRISLAFAFWVLTLSLLTGTVLGTVAGYFGGIVDSVIMRVSDIFLSFPSLLLAMIITAFTGPGMVNLVGVFVVVYWAVFARLIRGQVISIKSMPYIDAARIAGTGPFGIITKHLLPNCFSPVIAYGAMMMGDFIIGETALSFLGLGIQPPKPSWGVMLADARNYLFTAPWLMLAPGFAVLITVLGFNLLGDGLGYLLNPKQHERVGVSYGNTEG